MSCVVNDFDTEEEKIAFLKGLAQGIWRMCFVQNKKNKIEREMKRNECCRV